MWRVIAYSYLYRFKIFCKFIQPILLLPSCWKKMSCKRLLQKTAEKMAENSACVNGNRCVVRAELNERNQSHEVEFQTGNCQIYSQTKQVLRKLNMCFKSMFSGTSM